MAKLTSSDRIQTWKYITKLAASSEFGRINTRTIETVDFDAGIVRTHTTGIHEGDRVDSRSEYTIPACATPEKCADYRRRNGYIRIS